jgi:XRE family aerobic/anaerobic benzoate catabolism transcriptional regulator
MEPDRLLLHLGRRSRERRLARGLTLRELAPRAGLSPRFLVQVESGKGNISVRNLAALAAALGTSPAALLSGPVEPAEPKVVALLGLRGAGKTTVGRRLARRLRRPFVELDKRVEEAAGLSLDEIFSVHGEDYYRRLEAEALERVLAEDRPLVLATGGGLVTSPGTWSRLRQGAFTVWLRAEPQDHWNRVMQQGDRRPTADRPQAMAELRRRLSAREPLYAQALRTVDTSRLGVDRAVRAIEGFVQDARSAAPEP